MKPIIYIITFTRVKEEEQEYSILSSGGLGVRRNAQMP
jgi:hypothetical protein